MLDVYLYKHKIKTLYKYEGYFKIAFRDLKRRRYNIYELIYNKVCLIFMSN